ncbi:hypothetical protein B0J14DRAFT_682687 [Halenospora varia]|nr:hypothetical protein B0J14DRAFT_682687 [Halenospora varia]
MKPSVDNGVLENMLILLREVHKCSTTRSRGITNFGEATKAILESVPGLQVTVRVEGNPLEEYEDDEGVELGPNDDESYRADRTVSKYVEAISDKEHTIKMQVDPVYTILSPTLGYRDIVDGQLIEVPVIQLSTKNPVGGHLKDPVSRNSIGRKVQDGQFGNRILLQKYRFAKIEITNDGIRGQRSQNRYGARRTDWRNMCGNISHRLGPTTVSFPDRFFHCDYLDGLKKPIAIFKFKYRSKGGVTDKPSEALKQLLVLARITSPSPTLELQPKQINLDNLDYDQKERLQRLLQELTTRKGNDLSAASTIKRERESESGTADSQIHKKPRKAEMIDLTED